jgi:hypothetical protein
MVYHSRIGGDQHLMLSLGWHWLANGEWLHYGMPTSAGGRSPGGLTGLFVVAPIYVWHDYRAVAAFTALLHAGAFLLLLKAVRPALTQHAMWLLLVFVWLNPWRMYYSAHIWNANYMFAVAIIHLWTAQRMSERPNAIVTCLHVFLIAAAMQLHTSAFVLAILSVLLFWRKAIHVHWGGFAIGTVLGIGLFIPWVMTVAADPSLAPGEKGFFLRGLVFLFPLLRGILYSIKMASLSMSSRTMNFDFTHSLGEAANVWLIPFGLVLTYVAYVSVAPALWAHWRFVRVMWQRTIARTHKPIRVAQPRSWLRTYMALTLAAAVISFAISPTTVMFWQAFIVLPVAVLALIMLIEALQRTRFALWTRRSVIAWAAAAIVIATLQSLGAEKYACPGTDMGAMDPLQESLHVPSTCMRFP